MLPPSLPRSLPAKEPRSLVCNRRNGFGFGAAGSIASADKSRGTLNDCASHAHAVLYDSARLRLVMLSGAWRPAASSFELD